MGAGGHPCVFPMPPASADRPTAMDGYQTMVPQPSALCLLSVPCLWGEKQQTKLIKCISCKLQQSFLSLRTAVGKSPTQGLILSYHITLQRVTVPFHVSFVHAPGQNQ